MANISGKLIFDENRSSIVTSSSTGIPYIPIVLINISSYRRVTVLTDSQGAFSFINVPSGSYALVEAYGQVSDVMVGDFNNAAVTLPIPPGQDPPITAVPSYSGTANALDSITPNTLFLTISDSDLTDQNFLDGPIIYTPIQDILDPTAVLSDTNLITIADNGEFGTFPPGTPVDSRPPVNPYPGIGSDFIYAGPGVIPVDGDFTITNILYPPPNFFWWILADRTTGDETGRFLAINGANPSTVFFEQQVTILPQTFYLFSTWIANLTNAVVLEPPQLGVEILTGSGEVLYSRTLATTIPEEFITPQWKEIGTVIYSQDNTQLTVKFISEGAAANGNDYAIDSVELRSVALAVSSITPQKTVSPSTAYVGETLTYTSTFTNTAAYPLTDVFFRDELSSDLRFNEGSVIVNRVSLPNADPNTGFYVPNSDNSTVTSNETITITFTVTVISLPTSGTIANTSSIDFKYAPLSDGTPESFNNSSSSTPITIYPSADLAITKSISPSPVQVGTLATYTLTVTNNGPNTAVNAVVTDDVSLTNPRYRLTTDTNWSDWSGSLNLGSIPANTSLVIYIEGIVSATSSNSLTNSASVASSTHDPNLNNNYTTNTVGILSSACTICPTGPTGPAGSDGATGPTGPTGSVSSVSSAITYQRSCIYIENTHPYCIMSHQPVSFGSVINQYGTSVYYEPQSCFILLEGSSVYTITFMASFHSSASPKLHGCLDCEYLPGMTFYTVGGCLAIIHGIIITNAVPCHSFYITNETDSNLVLLKSTMTITKNS